MNAPHGKGDAGELTAALRAMLGELVRDAVSDAIAELRAAEAVRPELLTVDQLCASIQVSRGTLHRLRSEGLPCVLVGDSPRFRLGAVLEWLEQRTERAAQQQECRR